MQILTLIFAFLIIFAMMGQRQVEHYRSTRLVRQAYLSVMVERERERLDQWQDKLYTQSITSSGKDSEGRHPIQLNGKLNLAFLMGGEHSDQEAAFFSPLLIRLLPLLYDHLTFYKEAKEALPNLEEALVEGLVEAVKRQPASYHPKKVSSLSALELENPLLQEVWYRLLKGDVGGECGSRFPALACYVDLRYQTKKGISLYKAPPPLLLALFERPDLVRQFVAERQEIYKGIKGHKLSLEEATDQLDSRYGRGRYLPGPPQRYSFQVNTSLPPS